MGTLRLTGADRIDGSLDMMLTVTFVVFGLHCTARVIGRIDQMESNAMRRYNALDDGLVGRGVELEPLSTTAGDVPRIGPTCPHLPPDNVRAFDLGRKAERASRGLT